MGSTMMSAPSSPNNAQNCFAPVLSSFHVDPIFCVKTPRMMMAGGISVSDTGINVRNTRDAVTTAALGDAAQLRTST